MTWVESFRFDPRGVRLADRHYNRQTVGSPQFVPPGRCYVLRIGDTALWVTSWPRYAQHEWEGAWMNTLFRNEGAGLSSELIRAAVAHTRAHWPDVPALGMVTFVNPERIRRKRDPGRCYLRAGFERVGSTQSGLLAFQMLPDAMPDPIPALRVQERLFG